jgi:hypothetical protein
MEQDAKSKQILNLNKFNMQAMVDWNNMFAEKSDKEVKEDKVANFKKRIEAFQNISTLEEAKALLMKTIPVKLERTVFFIGDAKCTIINKSNRLRISLDSDKEFICYDFA